MSILDELKEGDVIYSGPDRLVEEGADGYYHLTYRPHLGEEDSGWAAGDIEEFLHLLGIKTKPATVKKYRDMGDLNVFFVSFNTGKQEMHPKAKAIHDEWKYKTNRKSIGVLLRD